MDNKKPFAPGLLTKMDNEFLKNSPVSWSSRIHLATYYGLLFAIFLTIICFIVPEDARNESRISTWVILTSIISLLGFIMWMIYLLRFNVFKRFGKWSSWDTLKTFVLYFIIVLIIVSWPFIPTIVQSIRANMAYSRTELVKDINAINIKLCQLERGSIDTHFSNITYQIDNSIVNTDQVQVYDSAETSIPKYVKVNAITLKQKLSDADSSIQLSDSVYVIYETPTFQFVTNYELYYKNNDSIISSIELYRQILKKPMQPDKQTLKRELGILFKKYSAEHDAVMLNIPGNRVYEYRTDENYYSRIRDKYDLYTLSSNISNITDRKYRWDKENIGHSSRVAYYVTLVLTLLVLIFRHTTRRTFFLTLLTAVVLCIITGLIIATSYSEENAFLTWPLVYYVIFAIGTGTLITARQRNLFQGITLNLLVFMTAFMPLVITAIYYSFLRRRYYYTNNPQLYDYQFRNEALHYLIAEMGGFILLLVFLATFFQKAYRKWYSSPEL
jgi:hypothetical protein